MADPAAATAPAGHGAHACGDVAPTSGLLVPAGQLRHDAPSKYVPAEHTHFSVTIAVAGGWHTVHAAAPPVEKELPVHAAHAVVLSVSALVPAGQGRQKGDAATPL